MSALETLPAAHRRLALLLLEGSGKSVCDSCGHARRMHSTAGCTWSDPKGNCRCPVTFMDL